MAIFIPTKLPKKADVKKELAKIEARGEGFALTKKDAVKARERRVKKRRSSSSRRRAAEAKAREDVKKRAAVELSVKIKAAADKARKKIEAEKIKKALEQKLKIKEIQKIKISEALRRKQQGKNYENRKRALEEANKKAKLFAESEFKIAQAGVNSGRLTVTEANRRLERSAIAIQKRVDSDLVRKVRGSGEPVTIRKVGVVTIGRKLTIQEKANLIRNTDLNIKQIDSSVVVIRNGEKFIESTAFNFRLKMPSVKRGQRVVKRLSLAQKGKKWLSKEQVKAESGKDIVTEKVGKFVAKGYKPYGKFTSKFIKNNPQVTKALLTNVRFTEKTFRQLRVAGLGVTKTLIDGIVFGKDAIKFLTINNPAWNKETRNSISSALIEYTPKVASWAKDVITNKEKRKLAVLGVSAFAASQLKLAKISPGRAIGKIGGEFILFFAFVGGWKAVKKIDNKLTKGLVKSGGRWIKQSRVLNALIKKSGKTITSMKLVGKNLVVTTGKIIKKPIKIISKAVKKLKVKQLNVKIRKAIKVAQKATGKKLTIKQKRLIIKQIRAKARGRVFTATEKKALRRALAQRDRLIKGVKVGKKEFKSYQAGQKKLDRIIKERAFGTKISSKGGAGVSQRIPKKPISKIEKDLLNAFKELPNVVKAKTDKVSITVISQKFGVRIPILKRTKRGLWEVVHIEKIFYQNTVSVSMFNKTGRGLGTMSWNTLSNKPVGRFRNVSSALKWGRGKSTLLSRQVDKKFIQTILLKARRGKVTRREFISQFKVEVKTVIGTRPDVINLIERVKETRIITKKVRGFGKVSKKFKRGDIVSRSVVRSKEVKQKLKLGKFKKSKDGVLEIREIIKRKKIIEQLAIRSKIETVRIDTSRIQRIIDKLNKIKTSSLSKAKAKMVRRARANLRIALKTKSRIIKGKKVLFINSKKLKQANAIVKQFKGRDVVQLIKRKTKPFRPITTQRGKSRLQLKQIKKVASELQKGRGLRESLSAASIPPEIKLRRVVVGALQKKKVMKAKLLLQNILKTSGRRGLSRNDIVVLVAVVRLIGLISKQISLLSSATTTSQINNVITRVATLQEKIITTVTKAPTKTVTKITPIITPILTPITPIRPRIPKKPRPPKKPPIIRKREIEEELITTKTLKRPARVFNVVIKKRGRNVILRKVLIERDAKNFMAYELDTTLIRTARLVPAGIRKVVTKLPKKFTGAFNKRKKKFRTFKIKRKKKIAIRGYIEKRKYSLDTRRERLQLGRLIKKGKKKRKIIKKKTTRTTRRKKKRR